MISLIKAFLFRDAAIEKTYRFHLAMKALDAFFQLAVFYFLSRLVSDSSYFAFVLIGLMFSRFFQFWMNIFTENIRQEQYWGTAELLFLSPHSPFISVLMSASGKFLFLLFELAMYPLIGKYLFHVPFSNFSVYLVPVILMNGIAFAGLGLISGSFILYLKRGDPANWLVSNTFDLLSGVYFPLSVLPVSLQVVSGFLPTTSALSIWRGALLYNTLPSFNQVMAQLLWAAILIFAGYLSFRKAVILTKRKGELGSY